MAENSLGSSGLPEFNLLESGFNFFDIPTNWEQDSPDWGDGLEDEDLLNCLVQIENQDNQSQSFQHQAVSTPGPVQHTSGQSSGRHANICEEDLRQLEGEKDEKNTKQVTQWAVRTFKGTKYHTSFVISSNSMFMLTFDQFGPGTNKQSSNNKLQP